MVRRKNFNYHNYMGDFFEILKSKLPYEVFNKVHTIYLLYNVSDMLNFDDFMLFRAKYKDVEVTFHQYVDGTWHAKILY